MECAKPRNTCFCPLNDHAFCWKSHSPVLFRQNICCWNVHCFVLLSEWSVFAVGAYMWAIYLKTTWNNTAFLYKMWLLVTTQVYNKVFVDWKDLLLLFKGRICSSTSSFMLSVLFSKELKLVSWQSLKLLNFYMGLEARSSWTLVFGFIMDFACCRQVT